MAHPQHLAVRVSDIERSTRFYVEALSGKVVVRPYLNDREWTEWIYGIPGLEYLITYIELPDGFGIELFQFLPSDEAPIGRPQPHAGFMHFAVHVDDIEAARQRGEAAGGRSVRPEPAPFGSDPARYLYLEDPDGNVVELNDSTWEIILTSAVELHPEAAL